MKDGGDINISVGGNVTSPASPLLPDFIPRLAGQFLFPSDFRGIIFPASWSIDHAKFRGIGALGSGDVVVSAGGNLESLTIALPTNGMPKSFTNGDLDIAGGGSLQVDIGGSIEGGMFLVDKGLGTVRSDGAMTNNANVSDIAPVIVLGDARISFETRRELEFETVLNSTLARPHPQQGNRSVYRAARPTFFFTYGPESAVSFSSLAGDIRLNARGNRIASTFTDRIVDSGLLEVFPGSLHAQSFEGSIIVGGAIKLVPTPSGDLSLLAGEDITAAGTGSIEMSDAESAFLPGPSNPNPGLNAINLSQILAGHATVPVHAQDSQRATVVARVGSVGTTGLDSLSLTIPKQTFVSAGVAVANLNLDIQHSRSATETVPIGIVNAPDLFKRIEQVLGVADLENELLTSERLDSLSLETLSLRSAPGEAKSDQRKRKFEQFSALNKQRLVLSSADKVRLESLISAIFATESLSTQALFQLSPEFISSTASSLLFPVLPIQRIEQSDRTEVVAGTDIIYTTPRRPDGNLSANSARINIAGAGSLDLVAGRNIDLGSSSGVQTSGNLANPALPVRGTDINVLTGNRSPPQFESFAEHFLLPQQRYGIYLLNAFGLAQESSATEMAELRDISRARFMALGDSATRELVLNAFYNELRSSTTDTPADYVRSNLAIATLFPLPDPTGASNTFFTPENVPGIDLSFPGVAALDELIARERRSDSSLTESAARQQIFDKLELAAERQSNDLSVAARDTPDTQTRNRLNAMRAHIDNELNSALALARTGKASFLEGLPPTVIGFDTYGGSVKSLLSRFTTLDGGNINFIVPGGFVNAGVASTGTLTKPAEQIGIVVQSAGDIRAFTADDFEVNSSRVFALDGGDIFLLSAVGNIDAGRGARSALAIPPPATTFDAQGNVIIEFPAAIAGSGIQAAVSSAGRPPGDVALVAPLGVVDAGDAGISSAGNLTIAATAVLGADNISVGGAATGVPTTAVSVPLGLASASSAAASSTKSATSGASDQFKSGADTIGKELGSSLVSMISVQFIGFGE